MKPFKVKYEVGSRQSIWKYGKHKQKQEGIKQYPRDWSVDQLSTFLLPSFL